MPLQEQNIPTFFQGVSKQPDSVRFVGQVADAENVDFSVETGGFGKRIGLRLKKNLTTASGSVVGTKRRYHVINRDANEKYHVVLRNGNLRVYDKDYIERTVTFAAGAVTYLSNDPENFALLTALDKTFITNKSVTVAMDPSIVGATAPAYAVAAILGTANATNSFYIDINGVQKGSANAAPARTTQEISLDMKNSLISNLGAGWTITLNGDYIFIKHDNGVPFTITQRSNAGDTAMKVWTTIAKDTTDLPSKALHGMIVNVKGVTGDGFWTKFEANNGTSGDGVWRETVSPGTQIAFDASTMPWVLVRNGDGTFTMDKATWNQKPAGGTTDVPPPDFVGDTITDIIFARNRLGFMSGETCYVSAAGDYFRFWPKSATELNDDDPFGLTNTTNSVSKFYFGVPFRRSVFVMADNAQFEIGGDVLTPARAAIDLATSYSASTRCRPVAVGDELYFPAESGDGAAVLSYTYEQGTVSETAADVTKHIQGFIKAPITEMAGDPIRGQVFMIGEAYPNTIYVHKFFYEGADRVQSAWGRYTIKDATIWSIGIIDGVLNILMDWRGSVWLVELPSVNDIYSSFTWVPRLDFNQLLTGTYSAGTGLTTWSLGFAPVNPIAVSSNSFPANSRMLSLPLTVVGSTVTTPGDWSAYPVMIGENFNASVTLSKQFLRDQKGAAVTQGRLQLRRMTVRYTDTGYFTTNVTPFGRPTQVKTYTGRVIGDANNVIQSFYVGSGKFTFPIFTNAESSVITISSDQFLPFNVVSGAWVGFYHDIAQG